MAQLAYSAQKAQEVGTLVVSNDNEAEGRIGRATRGPISGCVVLLEPYAEGAWLLYWVDPRVAPSERVLGEDVGDRIIPDEAHLDSVLDEELGIAWVTEAEQEQLRREFFSHEEPPKKSLLDTLKAIAGRRRGN